MKTLVSLVLTVTFCLVGSIGFAQLNAKLNPGNPVPGADVKMTSVNGRATSLKEAMGKNGLLVMFSCNTCPFVVRNQPVTQKTIQYATEHGIGVVIINSNEAKRSDDDSPEAMKKYATEQGITVPYLIDKQSEMADLFGANHTPEVFLFNNQSILVYKGAMNDNPSDPSAAKATYVNDAIDATIAGKDVNPQITKSIGCSIKRKA